MWSVCATRFSRGSMSTNPLLKEVGFDLYNFISNTKHLVATERRPMYLVQGDEVGKGATNEPLLRNVKIIKEL